MKNVIIYLPETGYYPYLRTLCSIGKTISGRITLLHCTGQIQLCNMQSNLMVDLSREDKMSLCAKCQRLYNKAKDFYRADSIELSEVISNELIENLKSKIPSKVLNIHDFVYKGFPVGKIAKVDLSLAIKFLNIENISEKDVVLYKKYVLDALISFEITNFICRNINNPLFLAFNPYTRNEICRIQSKKNGVSFLTVTAISYQGADYSKFKIFSGLSDSETFANLKKYNDMKFFPLLPNCVRYSWNDSFFRFYGSDGHVFSSKKTKEPEHIFSRLKLDKNKKTAIAFTSSNDEIIGVNTSFEVSGISFPMKNVFGTQIQWLEFLQDYALEHNDVQIVVRIHPREALGQNGVPSEHLLLLKSYFTKKIDNFVVVWADDPISSYDLLEFADLCLVGWSTMGVECARVGVPVLTYTSGLYYVDSAAFTVAKSVEDYEKKLTNLLCKPYTWNMLTDAVRYNYWRNHSMAVDCSDTIPHGITGAESFFEISSKMAAVVKNICLGKITAVDYNNKNWLETISDDAISQECSANLKGISDFYFRVFTANSETDYLLGVLFGAKYFFLRVLRKILYIFSFKKINIHIHKCVSRVKKIQYPLAMIYSEVVIRKVFSLFDNRPYFTLIGGNKIIYTYRGKKHARWSPLLYKLGELYREMEKMRNC